MTIKPRKDFAVTPTYRAMQVMANGRLGLLQRPVPQPAPNEALLQVEACGICGADRSDITAADPAAHRVPGHEVVGRIFALGAAVPSIWQLGQRVGVGRLGGHCGDCAQIVVENLRGLEMLVVAGGLTLAGDAFGAQGWLRLPSGHHLIATCGPQGATVWLKHPDVLRKPD